MATPIACTAGFRVLLFGPGSWNFLRRVMTADYVTGAGDPAAVTTKLSHAHGNTVEFAPFLALLFLVLALRDAPALVRGCDGVTGSRLLVVVGFSRAQLWRG